MKHLATTAELKEGLVLRAYRSGFGYARLVVAGVTPYFYVTEAPDDFYRCVEAGETLSGYLWTQNSVSFEFGMSVAGKISVPPGGSDSSAGDRRFLAIAHTVDITSSPERRCLKASVSLPFRFFKISLAKSERSFYTEEIDHLDGVLFIDHLPVMSRLKLKPVLMRLKRQWKKTDESRMVRRPSGGRTAK